MYFYFNAFIFSLNFYLIYLTCDNIFFIIYLNFDFIYLTL